MYFSVILEQKGIADHIIVCKPEEVLGDHRRDPELCYGLPFEILCTEMAPEATTGTDWWNALLKRNRLVSHRSSRSNQSGKSQNFNLSKVLHGKKSEPHNVYNVDYTGMHTAQDPNKTTAAREKNQAGLINTRQRRDTANAPGLCAADVSIPKKNFHCHFILAGAIGFTGDRQWIWFDGRIRIPNIHKTLCKNEIMKVVCTCQREWNSSPNGSPQLLSSSSGSGRRQGPVATKRKTFYLDLLLL